MAGKVSRTSVKAEDVAARKAQKESRTQAAWGWVFLVVVGFFVFAACSGGEDPAVDEPANPEAEAEARIDEALGDDAPKPEPAPEPEDQSIDASVMCQEFVKERLQAPATAGFPGPWDETVEIVNAKRQRYRVHSHVDAENGFGAQIRTAYVCEIRSVGGDEWRLIDLQFAE